MPITEYLDQLQKACLPGIWSKGVALNRSQSVVQDTSSSSDELIFRVQTPDSPVARKVTLWPDEEDWFCDCGDKNSVCCHIAASAVFLKTGKKATDSLPNNSTSNSTLGQIQYRFKRCSDFLELERFILIPVGANTFKTERLTTSLVGHIAGIQSGRIQGRPVLATQSDFAIDALLSNRSSPSENLSSSILSQLFKHLAECPNITLDETKIEVSTHTVPFSVEVLDERDGFRVRIWKDPNIQEYFRNGAALSQNTLKRINQPSLTPFERDTLSKVGTFFSRDQIPQLLGDILPALEKKCQLLIRTSNVPQLLYVKPKVSIETSWAPGTETLTVIPKLIYEAPPSAQKGNHFFVPDPIEEKNLARKLQTELQLAFGQKTHFEGEYAIRFSGKLKGWHTQGNGIAAFSVQGILSPKIQATQVGFDLSFSTPEGKKVADPNRVFQAWRENKSWVPLLDGGWAALPQGWFEKYGEKILSLIEAQNRKKELASYRLPELVELCEEMHEPYPVSLQDLRKKLLEPKVIEDFPVPQDLAISLRPYQIEGVNWLCFLRSLKMGAMLADDMGLGKTLQSLCAIQGKTLIVAPTSVLSSWSNQIRQYRPQLKFSVYHGSQRSLSLNDSDVVLTTYALLRLDREILTKTHWNTVILDEAQTIKNQGSLVSQAAHQLNADFRIALTGTPIENRLEDLWSQFQFLNPGLLGTIEDFRDENSNSSTLSLELKKKVRPFILRRLKKDVAKDLPPKTEIVLTCELSPSERDVYDALLASSKKEVLEKLEAGGSVFAALELLLRLRQACCHSALIPGQESKHSSKIELLVQTLGDSIAAGHRALVFSQWTSFLDLIEPALKAQNISYSRLDGTTSDREKIVREFQADGGPSVMLISLKAGGTGLTLTAADHIFLMDPWWNPSVENQAADRAHRIGQTNPVLIHRLVAQNTLEEKIVSLQQSKLALASSLLGETEVSKALTRETLLELLDFP